MDAFSFKGLHAVKKLKLSGNHIAELAADSFDGLICLEVLHLDNNQIAKVGRWHDRERDIQDVWLC